LEILKFLANLPNNLIEADETARNHSLILPASQDANKPSINDVLEILKKLAGLSSLVPRLTK
jgi:hypothetical protein